MKATYCEENRVQVAIFKPRIKIIQKIVCDYHELPVNLSKDRTRKKDTIRARQEIHFLCREFVPNCPLSIIGLLTGNGKAWDHASVSHSSSKIEKYLNFRTKAFKLVYPEITLQVNELRELIKEALKNAIDIPVEPAKTHTLGHCPTCGKFMRVKL